MKCFVIALVTSILSSTLSASMEDQSTSGDRVHDLLNAAFSYLSKITKLEDPIQLTPFDHKAFKNRHDPQIDVVATARNNRVSGIGNVILKDVTTDADDLTANFRLVIPQIELTDDHYEIVGSAFDRKLSGNGAFSMKIANATCEFRVKMVEDPDTKALSISELAELYNIDDVVVNYENIQVDGTSSKDEAENFVAKEVIKYFHKLMPFLGPAFADAHQKSLNGMMAGKTLEEVIQWLKDAPSSQNAAILEMIMALSS